MNHINEFGVMPGPYHYRGEIIVVLDIITHLNGVKADEPYIVFRPLKDPVEEINGKAVTIHKRDTIPLSEFKALNLKAI